MWVGFQGKCIPGKMALKAPWEGLLKSPENKSSSDRNKTTAADNSSIVLIIFSQDFSQDSNQTKTLPPSLTHQVSKLTTQSDFVCEGQGILENLHKSYIFPLMGGGWKGKGMCDHSSQLQAH